MIKEKLEEVKNLIPVFECMSKEDLATAIWNINGKLLYGKPAKSFELPYYVGYQLNNRDEDLFQAMDNKKIVHNRVPKDRFGIPIEVKIIPLLENDVVIGCISCVHRIEETDDTAMEIDDMSRVQDEISKIIKATTSLNGHISNINKRSSNFNQTISDVLAKQEEVCANSDKIKVLVEKIMDALITNGNCDLAKSDIIELVELVELSKTNSKIETEIRNRLMRSAELLDATISSAVSFIHSDMKNHYAEQLIGLLKEKSVG